MTTKATDQIEALAKRLAENPSFAMEVLVQAIREHAAKRDALREQAKEQFNNAVVFEQERDAARNDRDALRTALQEALTALAYYGPMPSHAGPCTPESGCDQECADAARFAEDMQRWKRIARGEG